MESLTALDLLVLLIDAEYTSDHPDAGRFKYINEHLVKRIRGEILKRDYKELEAAIADIKNIDPGLTGSANFVLSCIHLVKKARQS